jgi:hypothetical protein
MQACPTTGPTVFPAHSCVLLYSPTSGARGNSTFPFSNWRVVKSPIGFQLASRSSHLMGTAEPWLTTPEKLGAEIVPAVLSGRRLGLPSSKEHFLGHP